MNRKWVVAAASCAALASVAGLRADEPPGIQPLPPAVRQRAMATLRTAIGSKEFWPSIHAAEALTLAGAGDEVIAALSDRLKAERDDQRRCGLARELARAGNRQTVEVLFEILANHDSNGRVHAAESLYKIGEVGDGRQLRGAFEQTENLQLRLMAAATLAKAGHQDALTHLRQQLASDDSAARSTAAFVLARLGTASDVKPLSAAFESETDAATRSTIVCALANLGDARGHAELARNLDSADAGVRATSAECVGHARIGGLQAKLIRLLDDPALDTRVRAAQSLIVLSLPPAKR